MNTNSSAGKRLLILGATLAVCASINVHASSQCTEEPESKWLSEDAMRAKITELGYTDIKVFKKTKSGCYEIYGHTRDGRKAEVYFNPVDGSVFRENLD